MPTPPEQPKDAAKKTEAKRPANQTPTKGQAGQKSPAKPSGKPAKAPAPSSLFDEELPALESPPDMMDLAPMSNAPALFDEGLPSLDSPPSDSLSPLDKLLNDPSLAAAAATAGPLQPTVKKKRAAVDPRTVRIAIAAGAGLTVLFLVIVLVLSLGGSDGGEQQLAKANERYEAGDYAAAAAQFDEFLLADPRHAAADQARLRRGVARIQVAVADKQWPAAYDVAVVTLDEIEPLPGFDEALPRLTTALPAIATGLAADVRTRPDATVVAKGLDMLRRIERALPEVDLSSHRLDKAERSLGRVAYELDRGQQRETALAGMKAAAGLDEAYRIRRQLLATYPELTDDGELRAAAEATGQRHLPQWEPAAKAGATQFDAPSLERTVTLVRRQVTTAVSDAGNRVWAIPFAGSIYALKVADGTLLWRRAVGGDASGATLPAVPVSDQPDADLLVVDQRQHTLDRVDAASGRVRWRYALEAEAAGPPVVAGPFAWQAVRGRTLHKVSLESGESAGSVLLPQPPAAAPAVDIASGLLIVPGEQLGLYAVGLDGGSPGVFPLGHELGAVRFPPVLIEGCVVVAVDHGLSRYRLHVFTLGAAPGAGTPAPSSQPALRRVQELPYLGRIERLAVEGSQISIAHSGGGVAVFGVNGADKKSPLRPLDKPDAKELRTSNKKGTGSEPDNVRPRGAVGDEVPVPVLLEVLSASSRGRVMQNPLVVGETIGLAERDVQRGGCVITVRGKSSPTSLWQTHLAVPLAGGPHAAADGRKCRVVTAAGDLFELTAGETRAIVDKPILAAPRDACVTALTDSVSLRDGTVVATGPAGSSLVIYDLSADTPKYEGFAVPGGMACPPIVLGDALIVASRLGQVFAVDPRKQKILAALPLMSVADAEIAMSPARLVARSDEQCDLVDARSRAYRIVFRAKPTAALALAGTNEATVDVAAPVNLPAGLRDINVPLAGPFCVFGDHWLAAGCDGTLYLVKKP